MLESFHFAECLYIPLKMCIFSAYYYTPANKVWGGICRNHCLSVCLSCHLTVCLSIYLIRANVSNHLPKLEIEKFWPMLIFCVHVKGAWAATLPKGFFILLFGCHGNDQNVLLLNLVKNDNFPKRNYYKLAIFTIIFLYV